MSQFFRQNDEEDDEDEDADVRKRLAYVRAKMVEPGISAEMKAAYTAEAITLADILAS